MTGELIVDFPLNSVVKPHPSDKPPPEGGGYNNGL
jgi:hypothetical protein